jgi:hypothetical protein
MSNCTCVKATPNRALRKEMDTQYPLEGQRGKKQKRGKQRKEGSGKTWYS